MTRKYVADDERSRRRSIKRLIAILLLVVALIAARAALAGGPELAVHPDHHIDPNGRMITVVGSGYPTNAPVQLAECTGTPLSCFVLAEVTTNSHGRFVARVLVAFVLDPVTGGTCSEPTFSGDPCLIFGVEEVSPFEGDFAPITFAEE